LCHDSKRVKKRSQKANTAGEQDFAKVLAEEASAFPARLSFSRKLKLDKAFLHDTVLNESLF